MMTRLLMIALFIIPCFGAEESAKNVAIVKMVRGSALLQAKGEANGEGTPVKKGMWIREGGLIKTEPRSFVRLGFVDKSTMNVGPSSEMKIEKLSDKEASVINVLSGKIRSQVSKDYLKMDKDKSKMFVKSKSAVMGIRGTDFMFSSHPKTGATTAVLFEGSVVFNKLKPGEDTRNLESIVNRGRRIHPGQFSISRPDMAKATVPAKLSSNQFRGLKKNETFQKEETAQAAPKKKRSKAPPGLSGDVVTSSGGGLEQGLEKIGNVATTREPGSEKPSEHTKGFVKGDDVKPVDGSIVHIDSGAVIPTGIDSTFDGNTQEWVSASFDVNKTGEIVPPEGYKITEDGRILKIDQTGRPVEVLINKIKPRDETDELEKLPTGPPDRKPASPEADGPESDPLPRPPVFPGDPPVDTDSDTGPTARPTSSAVRVNVNKN